jgi:hypothetical protein
VSVKNIIKKIWLVENHEGYTFIILARDKQECEDLILEVTEGEKIDKLKYKIIGNSSPIESYYKNWKGESLIFYHNYL